MKKGLIIVISVLSVAIGCHPVKVSSACQAQISECLQSCSEGTGNQNEVYISPKSGSAQGGDTRTSCEKMCYHCSEQKQTQKPQAPSSSDPMNTNDYQPSTDLLESSTEEPDTDTSAPPTPEP